MARTTGALLRSMGVFAAAGWFGFAGSPAQAQQSAGAALDSVAISGQIVDADGSTVRLHADGVWLAIDMSAWSWAEREDPAWPFPEIGEEITAYAPLNASLFEEKVLRPSEIYLHGRSAYFRLDEGDAAWEAQAIPHLNPYAITPDTVALSGVVREVGSDQFSLGSGGMEVVIDTGEMTDDPLDGVGARSLAPGDLVQARGPISALFLEDGVLEAQRITNIVSIAGAGEG